MVFNQRSLARPREDQAVPTVPRNSPPHHRCEHILSPPIQSYDSPNILRSAIPLSLGDSPVHSREASVDPATADQTAPEGNRKVTTK